MFRRDRGICWLSVRCGGFDIFFKREEEGDEHIRDLLLMMTTQRIRTFFSDDNCFIFTAAREEILLFVFLCDR